MCFLCTTCGTQFGPSEQAPGHCSICADERQYVGPGGQQWTTLAELRATHRNVIAAEEPGLFSLVTQPKFGIGQRAFVVQSPAGNLLWDCVSLVDSESVARVQALGAVAGIAISHPHYYSAMVEWSRALGDVPIFLHQDDAAWVVRPDPCIVFWQGERRALWDGLSLVRTGGHFRGYQVLHWPAGADHRGVLLAGDQPFVCADRRWVSFMYSYPNLIPLAAPAIRQITASLGNLAFDRLYGAFEGQLVAADAQEVVARSAARYLQAIGTG